MTVHLHAEHHSMRLVDRGVEHVHRWQAVCEFDGWQSIPTRRRRDAEARYHQHVASRNRKQRKGYRASMVPGSLTPRDDWPEAWK